MSDPTTNPSGVVPGASSSARKPRVLIVDSSELGGLLQALFNRNEFDVVVARSGVAALDAILSQPPSVAIVELDLPDASGVDLLDILHQPPRVPVVVISSVARHALPPERQERLQLADGFFQKPLHGRDVLLMVRNLMGIRDSAAIPVPVHSAPLPDADEDVGQVAPPEQLAPPAYEAAESEDFGLELEGLDESPLPAPGPAVTAPPPPPGEALFTDVDGSHTAVTAPAPPGPPPPEALPSLVPPPAQPVLSSSEAVVQAAAPSELVFPVAPPPLPAPEETPLPPPAPNEFEAPPITSVEISLSEPPPSSPGITIDEVPPESVSALPPMEPPPAPHHDDVPLLMGLALEDPAAVTVPEAPPAMPPPAPVLDGPADPVDLMASWMRKREEYARAPQKPVVPTSSPADTGKLGEAGLAGLLDAFYSTSESGQITLRRAEATRILALDKGAVVAARSNVAGEQVSSLLVEKGVMDEPTVQAELRAVGGKVGELMDRLVKAEKLTPKQAQTLMAEHRDRVVRAAFRWHDATYQIQFGPVPRSSVPPAPIGDVILRGILGAYGVDALRERAPRERTFTPSTEGHYGLERLSLNLEEARVVIACDGTKTVADLLAISDLPEEHVLGLIEGLRVLKLVKLLPLKPASSRKVTFF
ncbi:MAG: response regulator [Myxococcota bacterium]